MLKSNWEICNLGDICNIVNGATPLRSNKEFWENGTFPWFTIEDIREQGRIINYTKQKVTDKALSKLRLLPKETVLLCCTASVGEYALTNIALTTNQQFNGLVIKNKEKVSPKYLMYYCSDLKSQLLNLSGKTTIDFIAISKLKNLEIPIPPLEEQRTIVAKLDQAFAAIDQAKANIEKNIANAKELFQSKLVDLFQNYDRTKFEVKTIKEITSLLGDGLHGTPKYNDKGEYYFINGNNLMNEGIVIKPSTKRIDESQYLKYKKDLNENTVLVSINGTLGNVGFYNNEKIVLGKSACYFNLKSDYDKRYIMYQIKCPAFLKYANKEATGATIKNVSLKSMRNFEVVIPKDLKTQQKIVTQLDQLQEQTNLLVTKYQQKLANLEELKKSILEKAFKGELV